MQKGDKVIVSTPGDKERKGIIIGYGNPKLSPNCYRIKFKNRTEPRTIHKDFLKLDTAATPRQ